MVIADMGNMSKCNMGKICLILMLSCSPRDSFPQYPKDTGVSEVGNIPESSLGTGESLP